MEMQSALPAEAEETAFSLEAGLPSAVEPAGPVDEPAVAAGRARVGEMCSVRKLSPGGAILHVHEPVEIGQNLAFELMDGTRLSGIVQARDGCAVTVRFGQELDVLAIIARDLASQPGERRRLPRVEVRSRVRIEAGTRGWDGDTGNLSQGGLSAALCEPPPAGTKVIVRLADFRALEAVVRWSADGHAGLAFDEEVSWQELMPWLRARARLSAAARPEPRPEALAELRPKMQTSALPDRPPLAALRPEEPVSSIDLNIPARVREGLERWNVSVMEITATQVAFQSFTSPRFGTLLWVMLPGLEGWPARVTSGQGERWVCEFTQKLHPAVLERVLAAGRAAGGSG